MAKRRAQRGGGRVAVQQTLQFLRLVGHAAADSKTCTLAVSVCDAARDPAAALEVAALYRASRGAVPDDQLFASLITGEPLCVVPSLSWWPS